MDKYTVFLGWAGAVFNLLLCRFGSGISGDAGSRPYFNC